MIRQLNLDQLVSVNEFSATTSAPKSPNLFEVPMPITKTEPLEAVPINRLISASSGMAVGIEYLWDTGETSILWRDKVCDDVLRVPIKD